MLDFAGRIFPELHEHVLETDLPMYALGPDKNTMF